MNFGFILLIIILVAIFLLIFISKMDSLKEYTREDYRADGFLNPQKHDFALTDHACERMAERLGIYDYDDMRKKALLAYKFGISKRQADKKTAAKIRRIEMKNENTVALLYDGCIYIFSKDNVLITVYRDDENY